MSEEPDVRFLRIAEAISHGMPVDWGAMHAESPELGSKLELLRALEAVAATHRQAAGGPQLSVRQRASLFAWGPLSVLEKLGEGGFGEVYRAWDPALQRDVALKLHRAEAAGIEPGASLWLDEARRLARVQHPNVLVVHGADIRGGRAGFWTDLLDGRTLEELLAEEGPISAERATRIGLDLCRALGAVHAAGLVHGDIKTSNVMRVTASSAATDGRIVLMDFGSAYERVAGETALRFATPLASAPEVLEGEAPTPASDLYSLGVLLYRLVTGRYPLEAKSVAELQERFARGERAVLGRLRSDLPAAFVHVVERALAPDPSARFADAGEMQRALAGVIGSAVATGEHDPRIPRVGKAGAVVGGALIVVALALGIGLWRRSSRETPSQDVVAVFPFRVEGGDPSLGYLREGMVDLLAAKLTGGGGPRAADPRLVLRAWRRAARSDVGDLPEPEALGLAQRLGAGQALFGSVVGTPGRLTLSATLVHIARRTRAVAETQGPTDSLPALVDRLTAQLLSRSAGEPEYRLGQLTTRSLPALRAYLEGQANYRRGRYERAVDQFRGALDTDTTFALAGVGLVMASWWGVAPGQQQVAWAWAQRKRLSARDRALLVAGLGPRYPDPSPASEVLAARERAVAVAPDRAEAWLELGDELYRAGPLIGRRESWEPARLALQRAVMLDSNFAAPLEVLLEMAAQEGDADAVRTLGAHFVSIDPSGDDADYVRWQMARVLGDHDALMGLRARFDRMAWQSLFAILWASQVQGADLDDAERAARLLVDRAAREVGRFRAHSWAVRLALNRGRPARALALSEAARELEPLRGVIQRQYITQALFWDGDDSAAARAARELSGTADGPPGRTPQERDAHLAVAVRVQLWRLAHGDLETASRVIAQLRAAVVPAVSETTAASSAYWAAMLEATLASAQRRPDAGVLVRRLDSLMATGPYWDASMTGIGNRIAAQLLEKQGDLPGALAAIRRRARDDELVLSTSLREEGRLAALAGDREGAIRAFRHYLGLRSDPEPTLRADVERVHEELRRLQAQAP